MVTAFDGLTSPATWVPVYTVLRSVVGRWTAANTMPGSEPVRPETPTVSPERESVGMMVESVGTAGAPGTVPATGVSVEGLSWSPLPQPPRSRRTKPSAEARLNALQLDETEW
jgi:hypothetical protein